MASTTRQAECWLPRSEARRLDPRQWGAVDRDAVSTWLLTRVAVMTAAFAGLWMFSDTNAGDVPSFLSWWDRWDTHLFLDVAKYGYRGYRTHTTDTHLEAFFPGEPMLMRIAHLLTGSWVGGALAVSAITGAVAMVALARLGTLEGGPLAGSRAVLYLTLSPYAVFLAAGYSESLFLAFALPSWLAARRGRWLAAGLLAGGASLVRIDGVFLCIALVVQWATSRDRRVSWRLLGLLAPPIATAGYFAYLHHITGDWRAWSHAQENGWGRHLSWPWHSFHVSWSAAFSPAQGTAYEWSFRAEIIAVLVGVALTVVLLLMRRFGEATYVGLQVAALGCSSYYLSVSRSTLLWFPLWLLLARWSTTRPWLHRGYLAVAPALMFVAVITFTSGRWVA
jgi:hypothetical protein